MAPIQVKKHSKIGLFAAYKTNGNELYYLSSYASIFTCYIADLHNITKEKLKPGISCHPL